MKIPKKQKITGNKKNINRLMQTEKKDNITLLQNGVTKSDQQFSHNEENTLSQLFKLIFSEYHPPLINNTPLDFSFHDTPSHENLSHSSSIGFNPDNFFAETPNNENLSHSSSIEFNPDNFFAETPNNENLSHSSSIEFNPDNFFAETPNNENLSHSSPIEFNPDNFFAETPNNENLSHSSSIGFNPDNFFAETPNNENLSHSSLIESNPDNSFSETLETENPLDLSQNKSHRDACFLNSSLVSAPYLRVNSPLTFQNPEKTSISSFQNTDLPLNLERIRSLCLPINNKEKKELQNLPEDFSFITQNNLSSKTTNSHSGKIPTASPLTHNTSSSQKHILQLLQNASQNNALQSSLININHMSNSFISIPTQQIRNINSMPSPFISTPTPQSIEHSLTRNDITNHKRKRGK